MPQQHQPIVLTPSPKAYFRRYAVGFLLSPLLIGLYLLWKIERERRSTRYMITEDMLTIVQGKYSRNIDLATIEDVNVINRTFGVGSVRIRNSSSGHSYTLLGLKEPEAVVKKINKHPE
jgi:hypothetical protein